MAYTPLAELKKKQSGYIPISQLRGEEPKPEIDLSDFSLGGTGLPGIQTTTPAILPEGVITQTDLLKVVAQGTARQWAATGHKIVEKIAPTLPIGEKVDPKTFFGVSPNSRALGVAVFGREEPFNATTEDVEFLQTFGVSEKTGEKLGGSITLMLSALDVTGGGFTKGVAGLVRALKRADNLADAAKALRSVGFAEDVIEIYGESFVKARKTKEVKTLLDAAMDIQSKTTKRGYRPVSSLAKEAAQVAPQVAPDITRGVSPDIQPLAQEAQKYKSVEEFVKQFEYHGGAKTLEGGKLSLKFDKAGGIFTTPNETTAKTWQSLRSGELYQVYLGDKKLIDLTEPKTVEKIKGLIGTKYIIDGEVSTFTKNDYEFLFPDGKADWATFSNYIPMFEKMGYKGARIAEGFNINTSLWEDIKPLEKVMTKSQLTDFYNQVTKGEVPTGGIPGKRGLAKVGLEPEPPKKFVRTEEQLLKERLRSEARGAKTAGKVARQETRTSITNQLRNTFETELGEVKRAGELGALKTRIITRDFDRVKGEIVDYVKANLDPKDRGKAITLVRDAKTQKNLTKAFARIDRWADEATKKTIRNDILKTQKAIMDSPSIAIDYKARIKELLGDFELKGHKEDTLERLKKTQEFLKQEVAKGNDVEMPRRILKSLEILNRTPFEQITTSQLTGLKAEMELLEDLGKTKFRTREAIIELQKEKIFAEIGNQGVEPINNLEIIRPAIGERLTITQKARNLWIASRNEAARIDKAISPMDTIFDLLDGAKGTYTGANYRFFKGRVDAGYGSYLSRKDALQEPIIELATKHGLDDTNFERIGVVAAREQDNGTEKLIATGFTEKEISAVTLTKQEQEVLDLMRSTFDSQFPEIQDVMRRVYNQPVEKVKNYFSFMTDWKAMDDAEVFQRFGSQVPEQFGTPRKNVEVGFTKARVGGAQKIKVNALDIFLQHTDNTSYLLELGETSKLLGEVAASPKYAELVGDAGQLMVREWVDVVARKGGAAGASTIPILDTLRKNVGIGILGAKLSTIAIQPTALIDGMGFIGVKYGQRGVTNFATDKSWREFVLNMPEIQDRMGGEFALRELIDDNWLQNVQRKGFIPMQTLDQLTAGSIAAGAYERKMVELGKTIDLTKGYDTEALEYAQLAIRRTQSSGQFKDVPLAISRGALTGNRSLDRAALQFQNFLLTRWSRIRHDAVRAGIATKDPKKAIPVLTSIIFASLAAAGIRIGVNRILDLVTGKESEDEIDEELLRNFTYEMTGNVPFLGTAVSMAMYDGEMFPILDAPKGVVSGLNRVITSKSETAKMRGFAEFAGSTGALLGIPGSAQAEQVARRLLEEEKKSKEGGSSMNQLLKDFGLPSLPEPPKLQNYQL